MWAWLFGPPDKTPDEALKEWRDTTRRQIAAIEREARAIQLQMDRLAAMAKREPANARVYAREIANARKQFERLYETRSQLKAMELQLIDCAMTAKMAQTMQQSALVATTMNRLVSVPLIAGTMRTMASEMTKMGLLQEMMEPEEENTVTEAAEEEVEAVLAQLTARIKLPSVGEKGKSSTAPTRAPAAMKMTL